MPRVRGREPTPNPSLGGRGDGQSIANAIPPLHFRARGHSVDQSITRPEMGRGRGWGACAYHPIAQPSALGSLPPASTPLTGSRRMICPRPNKPRASPLTR